MVRAQGGRIKALLLALLIGLVPTAGGTAELDRLASGLADAGTAVVAEVIDGDTVVLGDGREVRFVGIQAPKLPLGRRNFPEWPLAPEARAAVVELIGGRPVAVRPGETAQDRHGRVLAHLFRVDDGLWVQGEMLRRGLARVYTFPDNRRLAAEMMAAEADARAARRGMWALDHYRVRDAATLPDEAGTEGTFQVVRGTVREVAEARGTTYLNFGPDWRTDVTATLDAAARRQFRATGLDPAALSGREVLLRGWIRSRNGPMIELTHPEQITADPALVGAGKEDQ